MSPVESDRIAFIQTHTAITTAPLVPELRLHLATEVTPIWQASERLLHDAQLPPPFWAFAWPGGQALARHLLDNPDLVAGRRVLDLGAGSAIEGIAAARAGAQHVITVDLDAFACTAARMNAALNGVTIEAQCRDVTASPAQAVDVVLAGDVCYERGASDRIVAWLRATAAQGVLVLVGDPGRTYFPADGLSLRTRYTVATSTELEDRNSRETGVWQVETPSA